MSESERQELENLKAQVAEMRRELDDRRRQQIQIPLDDASIEALAKALYNKRIDRLTVKDLRYVTLTAVS